MMLRQNLVQQLVFIMDLDAASASTDLEVFPTTAVYSRRQLHAVLRDVCGDHAVRCTSHNGGGFCRT